MAQLTRRRFIASTMTLLAGAAVTACGNPPGTASQVAATSTGATPATASTAAAAPATTAATAASAGGAPAAAAGHITFSHWLIGGPPGVAAYKKLVATFAQENPKIQVDEEAPPGNYWQAIETRLAGGTAPDVMAIDNYDITALAAKGGAMALDSLISSTKYSLDIFYPISLLEGVYEGKRYGLPYIGSTRAMTFNVDLFTKANLASPADQWAKETWTWDNFSKATAPLTSKDASGRTQQFAFQTQHTLWSLATWIYTNGGEILNSERTTCLLDQPPAIEAIQFQQDLVNKYHVSPSAADVKDVDLNGSGRVAMWDSWRGEIIGYKGYKFNWDIALPPIVPKVGKVALYKGNSMALYSHTKQVDAAWQFAQYICGPAANIVYVSLGGASPVQVPEVKSAFLKVNPPAHSSLYLEPLSQNYAKLLPLNPHWPDMEDKIDSALQAVFDENQNVQQAMKALVPQVNQLLASTVK